MTDPVMQYTDLLPHLPPDLRSRVRCYSFSRWGGVSTGPFAQLNVGESVGDEVENVRANLELVRNAVQASKIASVRQVHGTRFLHIGSLPEMTRLSPASQEADGIFCSCPGLGIMVKHADCQAVAMFDPVRNVIANIHCGWRGGVQDILGKAVAELSRIYGTRPQDIWAGISPSLGPCCAEFRSWKEDLPVWMHAFQVKPDYFDFRAVSVQQLMDAGVPEGQISCSGTCTVCNRDCFSYRRDGVTGRLGTVIVLSSSFLR